MYLLLNFSKIREHDIKKIPGTRLGKVMSNYIFFFLQIINNNRNTGY